MRKHILTFLGLFIFIMIITPQNVFADTSGSYALDRTTYIHYNVEDKTDYYLSTLKTNTIVGGSSSPFYQFYQGLVGVIHTNNNKTYTPAFFQFSNSNGAMNLCNNNCDLMLTFDYGLLGRDTPFTPIYMQAFRRASTGFSGVKLIGIDINDEYKEFYCTGQYLISGTGTFDYPWSKFIATCPTSNFKSISRVQVSTGFGSVPNTTEFFDVTYFIESMHYTISAYTGTQDGIGGSVSDDSEPTEEEILDAMTDDNIDLSFQNQTMNDINSQMASNNVISDLLLLPVRMYQSILNSLGSNSCVAYNLGSLYGTNLQLPCIQVQNYIGNELWTTIDLIFCGMFILVIRKKFVDIFNNMTNLKNGGNEIE